MSKCKTESKQWPNKSGPDCPNWILKQSESLWHYLVLQLSITGKTAHDGWMYLVFYPQVMTFLSSKYFKIQIGPLERLPQPIIATEWKRITFVYTTGEYLAKAEVINDLVVRDDERQLLWRALRERAQAQDYTVPELPEMDVDPLVLASLLGLSKFD